MAIINADILISIGNNISRSVPSKLISYGKPIIHFSSQKKDVCCEYLNKYPLALIIHQNDSLETSCKKIVSFLKESKDKRLDSGFVQKIYPLNVPLYSVILITDRIHN